MSTPFITGSESIAASTILGSAEVNKTVQDLTGWMLSFEHFAFTQNVTEVGSAMLKETGQSGSHGANSLTSVPDDMIRSPRKRVAHTLQDTAPGSNLEDIPLHVYLFNTSVDITGHQRKAEVLEVQCEFVIGGVIRSFVFSLNRFKDDPSEIPYFEVGTQACKPVMTGEGMQVDAKHMSGEEKYEQ